MENNIKEFFFEPHIEYPLFKVYSFKKKYLHILESLNKLENYVKAFLINRDTSLDNYEYSEVSIFILDGITPHIYEIIKKFHQNSNLTIIISTKSLNIERPVFDCYYIIQNQNLIFNKIKTIIEYFKIPCYISIDTEDLCNMFRNIRILNVMKIFSIPKTKNNTVKDLLNDIIDKLSHRLKISTTNKLFIRLLLTQKLKESISGQDLYVFTKYTSSLPSHIDIRWDFDIIDSMKEDQLKLLVFNLKEI